MELTDFLLHTDRVPILDYMGVQIDEVALPERITPVPRRRCGISESHIYYKGKSLNINIYHKQTELEKDSLNVTLIQIIIFLESKYKLKKANSIRLLVSLA